MPRDPTRWILITVLLTSCLFLVATVPTATASQTATSDSAPSNTTAANATTIVYDIDIAKPGSVRVTLRANVSNRTTEIGIEIPGNVTATDGFVADGDRYVWNETTSTPTITYVTSVNKTSETFGGFESVATDEFGFAYRYQIQAKVTTDGEHQERYDFGSTGGGYAGDLWIYIGPNTVHRKTVAGQTLVLVMPEGVEMEHSPAGVLGEIANAAETLKVGGRDEVVTAFIVPEPIRGGGRAGRTEFWGNKGSWIHEYIHTRQSYWLDVGMAWFTEGSAVYYSILFHYRADHGHGNFEFFRKGMLNVPENDSRAVLTNRSTWHSFDAMYEKGSQVLAALDSKIRRATDGERTLQFVFARMNAKGLLEDPDSRMITYEKFADIVAAAAGRPLDDWLDKYVNGSGIPEIPDNESLYRALDRPVDSDGDGLANLKEARIMTDPDATDTDDDGLNDATEIDHGTDPTVADTDGDGLEDGVEVKEYGTNATVADTDGDGLDDGPEVNKYGTDPTDMDTDGDGLNDRAELKEYGTNATVMDTDGDGLDDGTEVTEFGTDPTVVDTDGDGLSDQTEVEGQTDPTVADTDGDGLKDGEELNEYGTDPTIVDTDGDGLEDGTEVSDYGTNPTNADTDGDGLDDGSEVEQHGTDPILADTDSDGLGDRAELEKHGTDPLLADTDGDGLDDGQEVSEYGTEPTIADTDGDSLTDGAEVSQHGTDPTAADSDGDGITDSAEIKEYATDPTVADTDEDGLEDGPEVNKYETDPLNSDTDQDGLSDGTEIERGTDPTTADTDGDGLSDGDEVNEYGSNPTAVDTDNDGLSDGSEVSEYGTDPTAVDSDSDGYDDAEELRVLTDPTSSTGFRDYWASRAVFKVGSLFGLHRLLSII